MKLAVFLLLFLTLSCVSQKKRDVASLSGVESNRTAIKDLQDKLSKTASIAKVGPNSEIVFYYVEFPNTESPLLNIRVCKRFSVIKDGENCKPADSRDKVKIPYVIFKEHFRAIVDSVVSLSTPNMTKQEAEKILAFAEQYGEDVSDPILLSIAKKANGIQNDKFKTQALDNLIKAMDEDLFSSSIEVVKFHDEKTLLMDLMKELFHAYNRISIKKVKGVVTTKEYEDYSEYHPFKFLGIKERYVKSTDSKNINLKYISASRIQKIASLGFKRIHCQSIKSFESLHCKKIDGIVLQNKIFPALFFRRRSFRHYSEELWMKETRSGFNKFAVKLVERILSTKKSKVKLRKMTKKEFSEINNIENRPFNILKPHKLYYIVEDI